MLDSRKEKLTRSGITYIFHKYVATAKEESEVFLPEKVNCRSLRHSKAMHLLQARVNLVYIRAILSPVSVTTTEIYARVDSRQKREVLEKAYMDINPPKKANR